ncbi:reverse transcriptase-like protein [Plakobranchus ocellatus]|uniref:Reverse transcriptase-like protein n=1 Tax=Plakobranchus ocellatus TaxID=259542 RepID=A0AAV4DH38_9GAST|nr:reverse transcriptase-like protein [Plakobranchus ocellatus]
MNTIVLLRLYLKYETLDFLDERKVCLLTLQDLPAAFDTIDHNILLKRLEITFGIGGTVLAWSQSCIRENPSMSPSETVYLILSFESVESHRALFLVPYCSQCVQKPLTSILIHLDVKYLLCADDSQIYNATNLEHLADIILNTNDCLLIIKEWMNSSRVKLNQETTEAILFADIHLSLEVPDIYLDINGT